MQPLGPWYPHAVNVHKWYVTYNPMTWGTPPTSLISPHKNSPLITSTGPIHTTNELKLSTDHWPLTKTYDWSPRGFFGLPISTNIASYPQPTTNAPITLEAKISWQLLTDYAFVLWSQFQLTAGTNTMDLAELITQAQEKLIIVSDTSLNAQQCRAFS